DARRWTWRELFDRRNRLASSLTKLGLARGETAIVHAPNSLEYLLASGAVRAVNALPVPMNHRLVADEVLYILDHSDAAVVFVGDPFVPIAEQIRSRAPNVRTWILTGAERRPWASSLDDLVQRGSPEAPAVDPMKSLVVAAAPCPMRVKEEALRYFGPCFYEFYGSTELGVNTILTPADVLRKPGSCGRAAPNVELALLDDDGRPVAVGEPGEVYI